MEKRALARAKKTAEIQGQTVLFLDESGFYQLPSVVRTWAPAGQTPVLRGWVGRDHLSAISAITPDGELYLQMQKEAYNNYGVACFLQHLLAHIPGKLLVIWDGSPIHRGAYLQAFLATPEGARIQTERFPGYAPELNPDELVWNHLKHVELRNVRPSTSRALGHAIRRAVKRLRRKSRILSAFVAHIYPV